MAVLMNLVFPEARIFGQWFHVYGHLPVSDMDIMFAGFFDEDGYKIVMALLRWKKETPCIMSREFYSSLGIKVETGDDFILFHQDYSYCNEYDIYNIARRIRDLYRVLRICGEFAEEPEFEKIVKCSMIT